MIVDLTHRIDVATLQKATVVRDKTAQFIETQSNVDVISSSLAKATRSFKVVGVDVITRIPFVETHEAATADEAEDMATTASRVVAEVTEGQAPEETGS